MAIKMSKVSYHVNCDLRMGLKGVWRLEKEEENLQMVEMHKDV